MDARASTPRITASPPPSGMWTSTSTTSGMSFADHLDGGVDLRRLTDDVGVVAELGAHSAAEQVVVVDQEDPQARRAVMPGRRFIEQLHLGALARSRADHRDATVALHATGDRLGDAPAVGRDRGGIEPAARGRARTRSPGRSPPLRRPRPAARRNGGPRSRWPPGWPRPARAGGRRAGSRRPPARSRWARPGVARRRRRSLRAASPRSRSAWPGARPNSQARSSRSWLRARPTTRADRRPGAGSRARVWSTESCRCAAISARSSERMRSLRSSTSAVHSRQSQGPNTSPRPPRITATARRPCPTARNAPCVARNAPTPATTSAPPTTTRRTDAVSGVVVSCRTGPRSRRTSSPMSSSIGRPLRPTINAVPIAASTIGQSNALLEAETERLREQQHPECDRAQRRHLHQVVAGDVATGAVVGRAGRATRRRRARCRRPPRA